MARANLIDNRDEVRARFARLRPDTPRRWGRMTAHQMVCHCTDAFRNVLDDGPSPGRGQRRYVREHLVKWVALYAPLPWPRGMKTHPRSDQELGGTPPRDFERDVADLGEASDRFATSLSLLSARRHFLFGELSEREWARWAYLHLDHHLHQFGL